MSNYIIMINEINWFYEHYKCYLILNSSHGDIRERQDLFKSLSLHDCDIETVYIVEARSHVTKDKNFQVCMILST